MLQSFLELTYQLLTNHCESESGIVLEFHLRVGLDQFILPIDSFAGLVRRGLQQLGGFGLEVVLEIGGLVVVLLAESPEVV